MPTKIQYFDLVKKAQQGKLGPEEMNRYFVVDAAKSTAFNPRFRLNYDAVDVTGMEARRLLLAMAWRWTAAASSGPKHGLSNRMEAGLLRAILGFVFLRSFIPKRCWILRPRPGP